jgi:hypothetical protein
MTRSPPEPCTMHPKTLLRILLPVLLLASPAPRNPALNP